MRFLAFTLCLFAAPATAESLLCELVEMCDTGIGCKPAEGETLRLDLDSTGKTGTLVIEPGSESEEVIQLRAVVLTPEAQTYIAEAPGGTAAFLTRLPDGTLLLSAHEVRDDASRASSGVGKCPKSGP